LPEWAVQTALCRADLVRDFVSYRDAARSHGASRTAAAQEYLVGYNEGLTLPQIQQALGRVSLSTVYGWEKMYRESGYNYAALAPNWGKHLAGTCSVTDEEQALLLTLCLHQNKVKIGTAIRLAKHLLDRRGIPSPSHPETMRRFLDRYRKSNFDRWTLAREGEKALIDKVIPYLERDDTLLNVGDVLVGDGHRCNFTVINPFTGKACRPSLIGFFDWASRALVGWTIMMEENVQSIAAALRMAILVLGKCPKYVLLDNGKAFKARVFTDTVDLYECGVYGMFARLGIETCFAWPYNARSKPIERFFGTLSDTFERLMPSFCGSSIDDKPASMRRNEKFMQSIFGDRKPSIGEVTQYLHAWREFYLEMEHPTRKGQTRQQVFDAGRGPGVDMESLNYLMLSMEARNIGRNGIRFLGRNYWNENLYGLKDKAVIRYDFLNLSHIFVYDRDGGYLGRADRVEKVHPQWRLSDNPMESLAEIKEGIKLRHRLTKETKNVVRLAVAGKQREKIDALPWDEMLGINPDLPEIVERVEDEAIAELEEAEQEIRKNVERIEDSAAPVLETVRPKELPWDRCYERYEWLLKQPELTDEQRAWMEEYTSGRLEPGEYEAMYGQKTKAGALDE
jgi:putative transposase